MEIEKFVQKLVKTHHTSCPFELAKALNIEIWYVTLPNSTYGFIHRVLRRKYIALNSEHSEEIQRFTCAHELGHYFFDKGTGYYFIEQHTLFHPGKYERRANRFAVTLLTHHSTSVEGETIENYFKRNQIPQEIIGNY